MKKFLALLALLSAAAAIISIVTRVQARRRDAYGDEESDTFDLVVACEGREFESRARSFAGGSLLVVCGGADIDLRNARLDPMGAYLEVDCWLGGIEIIVPDNWRVLLNTHNYGGGAENQAEELSAGLPEDAPTLEIDARIGLGGLDIRPVGAPDEARAATEQAPA